MPLLSPKLIRQSISWACLVILTSTSILYGQSALGSKILTQFLTLDSLLDAADGGDGLPKDVRDVLDQQISALKNEVYEVPQYTNEEYSISVGSSRHR